MAHEEIPFLDLPSSPWKHQPGLLLSAYKRVRDGEWQWRRVINQPTILKTRKAHHFTPQPFDSKWQAIAKKNKGGGAKKRQAAQQQADGESENDTG